MARVGVDVGGTNTDLVLESGRDIHVHKVASTPYDQSEGVLRGLNELCEMARVRPADIDLIVHGTTVATNITIEHNGAEVGMLTTRNFRDILHIGRHKRPHNFSLHFEVPWQNRPLVKRRNRIPITERILPPDGRIETPLDENEVLDAIAVFKRRNISSVVIGFLFSFINDAHERRAKAIVEGEMPGAYVCCSSDVANVIREFERFSTAAMNAFIGPKTTTYLHNLQSKLAGNGFQANLRLIQSNGGISTVEACSKRAVSILMSGPAGGVIGGRSEGLLCDSRNLISVGHRRHLGRHQHRPRRSDQDHEPARLLRERASDPGPDDRPRDHRRGRRLHRAQRQGARRVRLRPPWWRRPTSATTSRISASSFAGSAAWSVTTWAELVKRYGESSSSVPKVLSDYIKDRADYDYSHHGRAGNPSTDFVPDDIVDRFCVLGRVEDHIRKLTTLRDMGTDHFAIYLMHDAEDATLDAYGQSVLPVLAGDGGAVIARVRAGTGDRAAKCRPERTNRRSSGGQSSPSLARPAVGRRTGGREAGRR